MYKLSAVFQDTAVSIVLSDREIYQEVEHLFRYFHRPDVSSAHLPSFSVVEQTGRLAIISPNGDAGMVSRRSALAMLKKKVSAYWIDRNPGYLWLHAGAVMRNGRAVLFTGPTGCGKSSSAMACAKSDWEYLCDDVLAVEPESLRIYPLSFPPERRTQYLTSMNRTDFLFQAKQDAPIELLHPSVDAACADSLFFVQYVEGLNAEPDCETLTPLEAASQLIAQTFGARSVHKHVISAAVGFARRMAPICRLRFTDAESVPAYLSKHHGSSRMISES